MVLGKINILDDEKILSILCFIYKKGKYFCMKNNVLSICIINIFIVGYLSAREADEPVEQDKVGNFAVPGSVQPGPLLGFGQNVITPYEMLVEIYPSWLLGKNKNFNEITPSIVYGIRDDLSILLGFPTAIRLKYDGQVSSGSEDLIIQLEYAPYSYHTETATKQITLVGSLYLPSGNECKDPATGFGSANFFLGFTAEYLSTDWTCYTSYGVWLTRSRSNGNQFFYQAGVGKNIAYASDKWTLAWMLELSGCYEQRAKSHGVTNPNSGFNTIILGPSLWFSTERFMLQVGAAPVVYQHLFGQQLKDSVFIAVDIGCRFN